MARSSPPAKNYLYPFSIRNRIVQTGEILAAIIDDLQSGTPRPKIALAFHHTMAAVAAQMAVDARARSGIGVVALSGGCFQNRLLLAAAVDRIEREGFNALVHHRVPANDGGVALGQAVIAAARLNSKSMEVRDVSRSSRQDYRHHR